MDIFEEKAIKPMLIKDMTDPFNSPDYIYELKLDGIRCLAYLDETSTDLRNKRNDIMLPRFPELSDIHAFVKGKCILDGELIVIKKGVPDFFEVQRRSLMSDRFKIQLASKQYPASFVAYDILYINNKQIMNLPLIDRKKLLEEAVNETIQLAVSRYIPEHGIELFNLAKQQSLEGVIAKVKDSKYYPDKRTKEWVKFKFLADKDFVICGYIIKERGLTSLVLGQYRGNDLLYKGHVTMGVKSDFAEEYHCTKREQSPFHLTPTGNEEAIWLEPSLVCVVQYMPNEKGLLRQPVFKGIRDDKIPLECQESS
jgi:bifunctional non-homologous end joining protein LigD